MADSNLFHVQVVSPDRIFFEDDIEMLEVKTTEGEIGVLAGHIPLTSIVAPGVVSVYYKRRIQGSCIT